jgi:hypothetical protein
MTSEMVPREGARGEGSDVSFVDLRRSRSGVSWLCSSSETIGSGAVKLASWSPSFGTALDGGYIIQQRRLSTYDYRKLQFSFVSVFFK